MNDNPKNMLVYGRVTGKEPYSTCAVESINIVSGLAIMFAGVTSFAMLVASILELKKPSLSFTVGLRVWRAVAVLVGNPHPHGILGLD